jgi:glycosyl transferase family 8
MEEFIDVFVGADRSQLLAVSVLEHSIRRHTDRRVRVCPLIDLDLPEPEDPRQGSRTNFSFARFAIPGLKRFEGRALYLDADMQVFRDIGELWDMPLDGGTIAIQAELPDHAVVHKKAGAPARRIKQSSVMMIDCAKARWDVANVVAGLDGRYSYEDLLYDLCIVPEADIRYTVPFAWNSLEHHDLETRLVHYTDMDTQPWVSPANRLGWLWLDEVRLMLATGELVRADLEREIELGYFRPSLLRELDEAPHARGWNEAAVRRYAELDRKAGFVKHADVYRRKRLRAQAAKRYEAART